MVESAEVDWVGQMRDGLVPGEEAGCDADVSDGDAMDADNAALDGDQEVALNWADMLYEFEITREASNQLARLDPPLKRAAMNRLHQVGQGIWSKRLWHPLNGSGVPPQLEMYSTSFMKQYRVLWELSPEYSSATRTPRETIKIWYVGPHKAYEHRIDEVVKCFKEGRMKASLNRDQRRREPHIRLTCCRKRPCKVAFE